MSYFGLFMARYIIELAQAHLQIATNYQKSSKQKHPSGLKNIFKFLTVSKFVVRFPLGEYGLLLEPAGEVICLSQNLAFMLLTPIWTYIPVKKGRAKENILSH